METKKIGFIIFWIIIVLLAFVSILGIWEIISSDAAWKGAWSLGILGFGTLLIVAVGDKLFNTK